MEMEKEKLMTIFKHFAENEAKGNSPLYEYWCQQIVQDEGLLDLIRHIPSTQPKPNLFFASVQYLALKSNQPISHCFLHPEETNVEASFQLLKGFCKDFETELIQLFNTKLVQTNEVQRATYLYPIFHDIYQSSNKPLTLIEIGTSAGLLLNVDCYQYEISQQSGVIHYGDEGSPLQIRASNFGENLEAVGKLSINNRLGIDLNIIDLNNEEDYYWLQCLIWPEQKKRKENLANARSIHLQCEKSLMEGDFTKIITDYIHDHQDDSQIVLFHTHVANQFPLELKEELVTMLHQLSLHVPLYHVYNNMFDPHLHVDYIDSGETMNLKVLKNTDGHGNYFYWNERIFHN